MVIIHPIHGKVNYHDNNINVIILYYAIIFYYTIICSIIIIIIIIIKIRPRSPLHAPVIGKRSENKQVIRKILVDEI